MIPSLHTGPIGFSRSEQYLAEIAQRTFLSFWSHPNLFRSLSKELADLIVIFGDDIVVFSDKSCEYRDGEHGWSRWYRRAILDSAQQLHRAAGWLRKYPNRIYMDAKCERRFPLHVPASPRIHLVAVATGARKAAERHFGGDGSLILHTHTSGTEKFIVGDLDRSKDIIHVFDDFSLSIVLAELDTAFDFITYLQKRAAFLRSGPEIYANSEFDLLAYYLQGTNGHEHDFITPEPDPAVRLIAIEGYWNDFVSSGAYQRKKIANEDSYVWDRIIEDVAHHTAQGTLETGQENGLAGNEKLLRFLAAENRFSRRQLGRALLGIRRLGATSLENTHTRTVLGGNVTTRTYVFCVVRRDADTADDYRGTRKAILWTRMLITKLRNPDLRLIIGIGVGPADDPNQSVELMVREFADPWAPEEREEAEHLCDDLGISRKPMGVKTVFLDQEFPPNPRTPGSRLARSRARAARKAAKEKRKVQRIARKRNQ